MISQPFDIVPLEKSLFPFIQLTPALIGILDGMSQNIVAVHIPGAVASGLKHGTHP